MKTYEINGGFGLENMRLAERPIPVPGPNEVLIKMLAVSLNSRDLGAIDGLFDPNMKLPFTPGSDGVGEVVELGKQASRFKVGERVSAIFTQSWLSGEPTKANWSNMLGFPLNGLLAEYAVFPEEGLVRVPGYLTIEEASTLPCAGVTAWHAIVEEGKMKAGETVVVQGTGGVSMFALQFAKLHGAAVIITSSSDKKLERAKALGADFGINYKQTPDWDKFVLDWTNGVGADHIIDVGGANTLNRSLSALRVGGRISIIGFLTGIRAELDIGPAILRKARLQAINIGSRDMFEAMNRSIERCELHPVIDRVFPFENAIDALRYLRAGGYFGKICIAF